MSKNKHEDEELILSAKGKHFINFLVDAGYLADAKIEDPEIRKRKQEFAKKTYHNTKLLLEKYRDMMWSMECIPADLKSELDIPLADLDALIMRLDMEMSMDNRRMEGRLQSIIKSRILICRMNEAIEFLKEKPTEGNLYYDIIYHTYVAEKKNSVFDVMEELGLTKHKYYKCRKNAISLISMKLWSSPDSNIELMMELLTIFGN